MAVTDLETLLCAPQPSTDGGAGLGAAADDPGPALDYDADAVALDQRLNLAAQLPPGGPEAGFNVPVPRIDWSAARADAERLLVRSKDLRFATTWVWASLHLDGLAGLADGLRLVAALIARWGHRLHPQPDPDDGDMVMRAHALAALADPRLVQALRTTPLDVAGALNLRDLELADASMAAQDRSDLLCRLRDSEILKPGMTTVLQSLQQQADALCAVVASDLAMAPLQVRDMLAPLLLLTELGGKVAAAAVDGAAAWPVPGSGLVRRIEGAAQALDALQRIDAWLQRSDAQHPARLLLQRVRRLLGDRVPPDDDDESGDLHGR